MLLVWGGEGGGYYVIQGTTDLPIKPINRPILQDLPIIGITDPINLYIGSVSDRPIMGAIIGSSTDNKIGMNSATTNSCLMKIQCMNYKFFSLKISNYATSNFLKSKQQANSNFWD